MKIPISFLMEAKLVISKLDGIKEDFKRTQGLVVPSKGWSGGLAVLWKEDLKVDVQSYSDSHIDAIVGQRDNGQEWILTGFYDNPETSKNEESWLLLKRLSRLNSMSWVCLGDFNELMNDGEKKGGSARPVRQMEIFCKVINSCNL